MYFLYSIFPLTFELIHIYYSASTFDKKRINLKSNRKPKSRKFSDTLPSVESSHSIGFILFSFMSNNDHPNSYLLASLFFVIIYWTIFYILCIAGIVGSIYKGWLDPLG